MKRIPLILLLCSLHSFLQALTIEGYTADTNDRFANHEDFIANDFNLSGIGISSEGKWATMISPNVFATANHHTPAVGTTVTFYKTNDPSGEAVTRTASSTRLQIGNSDLRLVVLDAPLPEGYTFYARDTHPFIKILSRYWNKELFHFGRSPGNYVTTQNIAVGKNIIDSASLNTTVSNSPETGPSIRCAQQTEGEAVTYETLAQANDSGAPLFYNNNGTFQLVGISWFISPAPAAATGFTPLCSYNSNINDYLDTHSLPFQPLAPSTFTASRISSTQIDLSWQDNSDIETTYKLERAESAEGPWTLITLSANSESYSDTSAPAGDVTYRLQALLTESSKSTPSDQLTTAVLTPYSTWAAQYDWADADQSPSGDANNDGVQNLQAYSMNLSPVDPLPADALPTLESFTDTIDYSYRINPGASDLTYTLNHCTDLLNPDWQPIEINGTTITQSIDAGRMQIHMETSALPSTTFFQLEIETNDPP